MVIRAPVPTGAASELHKSALLHVRPELLSVNRGLRSPLVRDDRYLLLLKVLKGPNYGVGAAENPAASATGRAE
jgi:hypothetical protein